MTISRSITLVAFFTLAGLSLSGCGFVQNKISEKVNEKIIETASDGKIDVDTSENEYTVKSSDGGTGSVSVGSKDLSGITKVIALPDWITAGETSSVMTSQSDGKEAIYASLVSSKPVQETNIYWEQYFTAQGYQEFTKQELVGLTMMSGFKGADDQKTTLAVTVSNSADDSVDGTLVVIVYSGMIQE